MPPPSHCPHRRHPCRLQLRVRGQFWFCKDVVCALDTRLVRLLPGILSGQVCVATTTAQECCGTCSCHLKGCRAVAGCGGNQRLSPSRSPAGRGRLRPMQPNTCCAIAHQVARLRRGIPASAQRQARPRSQPRPGTRALKPPQHCQATARRRSRSKQQHHQSAEAQHHRPRTLR